ncbi:phosphate signaling complex protein PhoU [Nocardioides limicola]|uniref:phosphate signaling complex protein PhoU n=1 Tax=Nocardioides limicola TaxID=2803368 RepID=UPI00193B8E06|nr:phosphate signaling complex protein PhoU [Nocardioides sp. DJM-14]
MREAFTDQLRALFDDLAAISGRVEVSLERATRALLSSDVALAESVIADDAEIDAARERLEEVSFSLLSLQAPVAGDLRVVVAALRMVSDLERMGDLAVHIAKIARMRAPGSAVPEFLVPSVRRMAHLADSMVAQLPTVIAERDVDIALDLARADSEIDQLRRELMTTVLSDDWSHGVEPAVDLALLGRYYERMADHAVSVARRVVFVVTGEQLRLDA